ncbi:hypothetical protein M5K25_008654 [Dendrobium thyrsiflorum]|uniref:Uncharacterized protein n=1 Tax=Dendrobium thyrsiflorum TaxID=117978 RepID=A0ABD0V953_DENTH
MCQPTDYSGLDQVTVGNDSSTPITHIGQGLLPLLIGKLLLSQILHTPQISHNLLSIHKLTQDNNISIHFDAFGYKILDQFRYCIHQGPARNGLYPLHLPSQSAPTAFIASISSKLCGANVLLIHTTALLQPYQDTRAVLESCPEALESLYRGWICELCVG